MDTLIDKLRASRLKETTGLTWARTQYIHGHNNALDLSEALIRDYLDIEYVRAELYNELVEKYAELKKKKT